MSKKESGSYIYFLSSVCQLMSSELPDPPNELLVAVDMNNKTLVGEWREEQRPSPRYRWCLIAPLKTAPNIIS